MQKKDRTSQNEAFMAGRGVHYTLGRRRAKRNGQISKLLMRWGVVRRKGVRMIEKKATQDPKGLHRQKKICVLPHIKNEKTGRAALRALKN